MGGSKTLPQRLKNLLQKNKKTLCAFVGVAVLAFVGSLIPPRIAISPTPSVGYHVFYCKRHFSPSEIKKGTLVSILAYIPPKFIPNCQPCLITKYVACLPGEKLVVKNRQYFCNGVYLGTAKTHSLKGVPVKNFVYNGIIPPGKFFAIGIHKDSYDSRYAGLEDLKNVKAVLIPIF